MKIKPDIGDWLVIVGILVLIVWALYSCGCERAETGGGRASAVMVGSWSDTAIQQGPWEWDFGHPGVAKVWGYAKFDIYSDNADAIIRGRESDEQGRVVYVAWVRWVDLPQRDGDPDTGPDTD